MRLKLPSAPPELDAVVSHALAHFAPPAAPSFDTLTDGAADGLEAALPHPVYTLSVESLLAGKGLASVARVGWRVLILAGDIGWGAIQWGVGTNGHAASVLRGPPVQETLDALQRAEAAPETAGVTRQVRLLDIPEIYLTALWLYHRSDSRFVALSRSTAGTAAHRLQDERGFLAVIRRMAKDRMAATAAASTPLPMDPVSRTSTPTRPGRPASTRNAAPTVGR